MFKAFLKIYWSRLLLVGEPLGIFALIFYLIDGNWAYYRLGAELSLFWWVFIWHLVFYSLRSNDPSKTN